MKQLQQGDVLLQGVNSLPTGVRKVKKTNRGYVIAEGESTGHAHVITGDCEVYELDGVIYISTSDKSVNLVHEEHHTVEIPAHTIMEVALVQEYDPFTEELHNVQD